MLTLTKDAATIANNDFVVLPIEVHHRPVSLRSKAGYCSVVSKRHSRASQVP